jgi:hypothetical protein
MEIAGRQAFSGMEQHNATAVHPRTVLQGE